MECNSVSFKLKHRWDGEYDNGLGTPIYEVHDLTCNVLLDGIAIEKKGLNERTMVIRGQQIVLKKPPLGGFAVCEEVIKNGTLLYPFVLDELLEILEISKEAMGDYIKDQRELLNKKAKEKEEWLSKNDVEMSF